jgi:uncharacterized RmlC-like cupin family protein/predicted alpha/beta-hydrolase family hydrolase
MTMPVLKPAFVLVHGAWHGAATWEAVTPLLEAQGYAARTLDLPGAGALAQTPLSYARRPLNHAVFAAEPSPNAGVTQEQRTRAVIALVEKTAAETGGPVVLVGHSLGGLTVSAVAEAVPQHLHAVVYLCAFMLPAAMSAVELTSHPAMAGARVKRVVLADPQAVGAMRIDFHSADRAYRDLLQDCFAGDVSGPVFDRLRAGLHCDEPLGVFLTPGKQTAARFGRVPRHYIRCLEDRTIPLAGQDFMIEATDAAMGTTTNVHDLATSHAPYASQPAALTRLLVSIAARRAPARIEGIGFKSSIGQPAGAPALRVVRAGPAFRGKQGHIYSPALSAESVGTKAIHMQMLTIPPGETGRAHKHEGHETAIYILSGESGVWFGENLEFHETAVAGEYVYIPAGLPHMPYNLSDRTDCVAIIARTDPNEQESVVLLPDLEARHAQTRPLHTRGAPAAAR